MVNSVGVAAVMGGGWLIGKMWNESILSEVFFPKLLNYRMLIDKSPIKTLSTHI